jgi:tetratricopeptide (TPR) repeat protein
MLREADDLLEAGQTAEAFERYDRALDADPSDASVLLRAGMALLQAEAFHEAYLYLEQAAAALPDDPEVLRLMGAAALGGGQGDLALEALERCRAAGGATTADMLLDLTLAAYWALDVPRAVDYAREAGALSPDSAEARAWIAKLEGFEDDHTFLVDVARGHCRQGRFGLGADLMAAAFRVGDSLDARVYGARAMLAAGRLENAIELFKAAVDMAPDDAELAAELSLALAIAGEDVPAPAPADPVPLPQSFCTQCGARLRESSLFCSSCGTPVKGR